MQLLGRYAYLGTEAELSAVSKSRRHIGIHTGGIDIVEELFCGIAVLRHYALAVLRAVDSYEIKRLVYIPHRLKAHTER